MVHEHADYLPISSAFTHFQPIPYGIQWSRISTNQGTQMKVAAIAPRIISFHVDRAQRTFAGSAARTMPTRNAEESIESGRVHLTPREREVLALLCEGLPNKSIGRQLNISAGTVKIHVGKILSGLGASSRLQAVIIAHRQGLLEESDDSRNDQDGYDAVRGKRLQRDQLHSVRAA